MTDARMARADDLAAQIRSNKEHLETSRNGNDFMLEVHLQQTRALWAIADIIQQFIEPPKPEKKR
jgi:hypothetical protein